MRKERVSRGPPRVSFFAEDHSAPFYDVEPRVVSIEYMNLVLKALLASRRGLLSHPSLPSQSACINTFGSHKKQVK